VEERYVNRTTRLNVAARTPPRVPNRGAFALRARSAARVTFVDRRPRILVFSRSRRRCPRCARCAPTFISPSRTRGAASRRSRRTGATG